MSPPQTQVSSSGVFPSEICRCRAFCSLRPEVPQCAVQSQWRWWAGAPSCSSLLPRTRQGHQLSASAQLWGLAAGWHFCLLTCAGRKCPTAHSQDAQLVCNGLLGERTDFPLQCRVRGLRNPIPGTQGNNYHHPHSALHRWGLRHSVPHYLFLPKAGGRREEGPCQSLHFIGWGNRGASQVDNGTQGLGSEPSSRST